MADDISPNGQVPGKFDKPPDPYTGFMAFPNPLTYPQFTQWWKVAVQPLKEKVALDFEHWDGLFKAGSLLIADFGEWQIEGPMGQISVGELKAGNIPLLLEEWVCVCSRAYIFPMLDPKKSHMLRTLF